MGMGPSSARGKRGAPVPVTPLASCLRRKKQRSKGGVRWGPVTEFVVEVGAITTI